MMQGHSFIDRRALVLSAFLALSAIGFVGPHTAVAAGAEGRILIVPHPRRIVAVSPRGVTDGVLFRAGDGQIIGPAGTPDGRQIAFILRRTPRRVGRRSARIFAVRDEIWVMHGNGTGAHVVLSFVRRRRGFRWIYPQPGEPGADHGLESIDISPNGRRILVARGDRNLYTLNADGSGFRHVRVVGATMTGYTGSDRSGPQFSPGGRKVIAHFATPSREGIGTMPVHGGRVRFFHTKRHALAGTYSDDGRWIAFSAIGPPPRAHSNWEGGSSIWIMRADGSREHQIAARPGLDPENPGFSPDGRSIVFAAERDRVIGRRSAATYIVSVGGGPIRRIARGVARFYLGNPDWVR